MGNFVPQIDRPGFVPQKHHRPFGGVGQCLKDIHPGGGRINQGHIMILFGNFSSLVFIIQGNERSNLQPEFHLAGDTVQFFLNPLLFIENILLSVKTAPVSPGCFLPPL